jgi:hypothetical protein
MALTFVDGQGEIEKLEVSRPKGEPAPLIK